MFCPIVLRYLILTLCLALTIPVSAQESSPYQAAIDYSDGHRADALLIYQGGELLVETYNPRYDGQQFESTDMVRRNAETPEFPADAVLGQPDVIFASGANHQLLYVIPALDMVIVRFGRRTQDWRTQDWTDSEFLRLVTEG